MANGLDKLERFFFHKRKALGTSGDVTAAASTVPSSPTKQHMDLQFPSPSFIRPKTSRMAAREEVRYKYPESKFPTVNEPDLPQRYGSIDSQKSSLTSTSHQWKHTRLRSSSLDSERSRQICSTFDEFGFPKPPARRGHHSPCELDLKPLPDAPSRPASGVSSTSQIQVPSRLDTPPSSDVETECPSMGQPNPARLANLHHKPLPTPESSPEIGPLPDWELLSDQTIDILNQDLCDDIQRKLEESMATSTEGSVAQLSQSQLSDFSSPHSSFSSCSLQEPEVCDFFRLSDENVAESYAEGSLLSDESRLSYTSITLAPSVSSLPLRDPPLLTLAQPSTSRPARAAAFEAARIASRYKFDMLYVVNLWSERGASLPANDSLPNEGMTGRLLAAYGLHHSKSPFQISSEVHTKILQSSGWVEYRDEQADNDEFACAYAYTFYPRSTGDKRVSDSSLSTQSVTTASIDRGIVFAAYRKKATQNVTEYPTPEELGYLSRDVETMIQVLIDIHVTNQKRQARSQGKYSDETGPMPVL